MIRNKLAVFMSVMLLAVSCALAQTPVVIIGSIEHIGSSGSRPGIATDAGNNPHIIYDAGGMVYFYDKIGGIWRASSISTRASCNSSQYANPHIEIDNYNRAWYSGILMNSIGMGILIRNNITTAPSSPLFSRHNPMPSSWPTGNFSLDLYNNLYVLWVSGGYWDTYTYDPTAVGAARKTNSGRMYCGIGGEANRINVSKTYPILHADGVLRPIWHLATVAHSGYGQSYYKSSKRHYAGQGSVAWANPGCYPGMGTDGSYVNVKGDRKNPEIAYVFCDLNSDGGLGGVWGNVYNPGVGKYSGMTANPDSIICVDRAGYSGLRRYEPGLTGAKNGGAFVVYGNKNTSAINMKYVSQAGVVDSKTWHLGYGARPNICTDSQGNLHVTYCGSGGIKYVKILVAGGGQSSLAGDFDGDGRTDPAVYDSSNGKWFIYNMTTGKSMTPRTGLDWGYAGAVAAPGDFDGDGCTDLGVYDPSNGKWFIYSIATGRALTPRLGLAWGFAGATPVVSDYNGDRRDDLGVYDSSSGKWFIYSIATGRALTPRLGLAWGFAGATPVPADYDGDRCADLGIYDTSSGKWFIYSIATGRALTPRLGVSWGFAGATPIAADYSGDGRADLGIFDPSSGKWFIYNRAAGVAITPRAGLSWGFAGVTPVKGNYFKRPPALRAADPDEVVVYNSATGKWYMWSIQENEVKLWGMHWGYAGASPIGAAN